ncbi:hypothetical protein BHE74_00026869 [Ensete ventricosum]|nr:hypothetical protein BHE74_00026869 [Ensete ventricosum]
MAISYLPPGVSITEPEERLRRPVSAFCCVSTAANHPRSPPRNKCSLDAAPRLFFSSRLSFSLICFGGIPRLPPSPSPPPCFPSRMGSLEAAGGAPPKRSPLLRPFPPPFTCRSSLHRLSRFLLSDKVGYVQWVFTVAAFLIVVALFQAFLPGSSVERPGGGSGAGGGELGEIGELDLGEGIRFVPVKLLERWDREDREANSSISAFGQRPLRRFGLRNPLLALVVPDLLADAMQLQMVSIAVVLKEIGYDIQLQWHSCEFSGV